MNQLRKLYDWVLHWAETPYAVPALIILAFAESSFFPIPVDVLLIAMALSIPKYSFRYAAYTSLFSVLGGIGGYIIGYYFMQYIGNSIIGFYGYEDHYNALAQTFQEHNFIAILVAALTPIPYKVFTITAGAANANFMEFMGASILGRSLRFFTVSALIYYFGERIKDFIDRYFNFLSIIFAVLLVGGFVLIKYLF
jgi:membrane protein YqaA with SNARE-associated domain|tara:strand:- start:556 stop:1143 length:588 start_codon:yes stop_codon:yes gene_type:complete